MIFTPQEEMLLRSIKKSDIPKAKIFSMTTLQYVLILAGGIFLSQQKGYEGILPFCLMIAILGCILLSYFFNKSNQAYISIIKKFMEENKEKLEKDYRLLRDENIT